MKYRVVFTIGSTRGLVWSTEWFDDLKTAYQFVREADQDGAGGVFVRHIEDENLAVV